MNKTLNIVLFLSAAVLSLVACKPEKPAKKDVTALSAEISVPQGVSEYGKYFVWDENASIGFFSAENQNAEFRIADGKGRKSAYFEGTLPSVVTEFEPVSAYYPFRPELESSDIEIDLTSQRWKAGDSGLPEGLFVAAGEAEDPSSLQLSFKPVMPYVVFRIQNAGSGSVSLRSVALESAANVFPTRGYVDILAANPVAKTTGTPARSIAVQLDGALNLSPSASANIPMCLFAANPGSFNVVLTRDNGEKITVEKSLQGGFKTGNLYFFDLKLTEDGADETSLVVANFNIRFLDDNRPDYDAESGGQPWRFRRPAVKAFFEQSDIDICGLEEVRKTQLANLEEDLGEDWFIYCPGRISGGKMTKTSDESCGVMYRKSRFNLLGHGCFWLSDSPSEVGSTRIGQDSPRIASWLHLEDKSVPGKEVWFFSAHINWAVSSNRQLPDQEVETILSQMEYLTDIDRADFKNSTTPVFLVGDLNNTSEKSPVRTLMGLFNDARTDCPESASTYRCTYNAFGNESNQSIIDYIFYGAGNPKEYIVDNSTNYAPDVYYISDHYPVIFKLSY